MTVIIDVEEVKRVQYFINSFSVSSKTLVALTIVWYVNVSNVL
jgi:hypothetical protein